MGRVRVSRSIGRGAKLRVLYRGVVTCDENVRLMYGMDISECTISDHTYLACGGDVAAFRHRFGEVSGHVCIFHSHTMQHYGISKPCSPSDFLGSVLQASPFASHRHTGRSPTNPATNSIELEICIDSIPPIRVCTEIAGIKKSAKQAIPSVHPSTTLLVLF